MARPSAAVSNRLRASSTPLESASPFGCKPIERGITTASGSDVQHMFVSSAARPRRGKEEQVLVPLAQQETRTLPDEHPLPPMPCAGMFRRKQVTCSLSHRAAPLQIDRDLGWRNASLARSGPF